MRTLVSNHTDRVLLTAFEVLKNLVGLLAKNKTKNTKIFIRFFKNSLNITISVCYDVQITRPKMNFSNGCLY